MVYSQWTWCHMQSCFIFVWSLNVLNTTVSINETVVTSFLIPATTFYLYNPTQCRHNIIITIHSIHYMGIIYCNWLWCCDPPAASTIHLMIVFDSFYSITSNLLLPPFPITHPRMHTSTWPKRWNTLLSPMSRRCWLYYCGESCSVVFWLTAYVIRLLFAQQHTRHAELPPQFLRPARDLSPPRVAEWYKDNDWERDMLSHSALSNMNHESSKTPVTGV